jgi:hypothetical protein
VDFPVPALPVRKIDLFVFSINSNALLKFSVNSKSTGNLLLSKGCIASLLLPTVLSFVTGALWVSSFCFNAAFSIFKTVYFLF